MMMQHDEHDEAERLISNTSAINRHRQHDQAIARGMATAMRNVAARIESIERAIGLQAIEIERLDSVLTDIMQQRPGAPDQQIDQPAMQPVLDQAISDAG